MLMETSKQDFTDLMDELICTDLYELAFFFLQFYELYLTNTREHARASF